MSLLKDTTIRKRVMARVERKIALKQAEFDKECEKVDKNTEAELASLRQQMMVVEGARSSKKAEVADKIVDDIVKAIA